MTIGCAILGATGAVGQRFIQLLNEHPTFHIQAVVASNANAGRRYHEAADWRMPGPLPDSVGGLPLQTATDLDPATTPVVFSALPGGIAGPVESDLASRGFKVFTNARDHRMDPDVPLLIPEVNPEHLAPVRGRDGFIVANGNCSGIILTLALAPIQRAFGIASLDVTTMQARSGAGHPDRVDLDTADNVLPFIGGEEDKLETEPHKVLGTDFPIHATCTRVDVSDGHFESIHARIQRPATADDVADAFRSFRGPEEVAACPSAPRQPIHVLDGDDAPQPKRHRDLEDGMAVSVGRIRVDGDHVRFLLLGHNTVRGAAGQSILNAEYAAARNLL